MHIRTLMACLAVPFLLAARSAAAGTLSVTILDERNQPTPARVYLLDAAGAAHFAPDTIVYDKTNRNGFSERHFVPPAGTFQIDLPAGKYRLIVERGKEQDPVDQQIDVPGEGAVTRSIQCPRWIEMAARRWYAGDMHVHRPLSQLSVLMQAEDLDVAVPLTRWRHSRNIAEDPDLPAFVAKSDEAGMLRLGPHRFISVLNEELEPDGHAVLVSHLGRTGTAMPLPLLAYSRMTHQLGAVVDVEKATTEDLPILAALGACETTGLTNNHIWRSGGLVGPWGVWPKRTPMQYPVTSAGYAQAGFDIYSYLLDMGFRIVPSAGTASGVHPVPLGWSRIYVHVPGEFTPQAWYDALRQGRSFVTTGPMLLLTVAGHEPGEEVKNAEFPMNVEAEVEMLSRVPVESAEVVVNGQAHRVALKATEGRPHSYQGRLSLKLETSAWITARWLAERPGSCDVAHTGPVYFWKNNEPVPIPRKEAEYLLGRVEAMIADAEAQAKAAAASPAPAVWGQAITLMKEAREVYQRKLAEAR